MGKVKFLAIDDHLDNLVVLKALLNEAFPQATFIGAQSGKQGIEICHSEKPAVILLDIVMPEMDGYEVCRILKTDEATKTIPIIMITAARTDKESRIKALESGSDAFLAKPVDESELTAQIRAMLRIKELEDRKLDEKERLVKLVSERTRQLETELEEHKQAVRALLESEETIRTLLNGLPESTFLLDLQGNIIEANSTIAKRIGFTVEQMKGQNIFEFVSPKIANKRKQYSEQVIQTGLPVYFEDDFNGHFIDNRILPIFNQDGRVHRLVVIGMDITERIKAQAALKESEEKFRNLFENMNDAFALHKIILDENGKPIDYQFIDVNPVFCNRLGMKPEDIINQTALKLFPKTEPYWIDVFGKVATTGEDVQYTNYSVELDKYYESRIYCPRPGYFACLFSDVTEQKKIEKEIKKSETKYRLLADHVTDTVWMMDLNLTATYISPSIEKLRGFTLEETMQLPLEKQLTPNSYQLAMQVFSEEMNKVYTDPTYTISCMIELEFYRKDGSTYWSENSFSLIRDENGIPVSILGEGRDITTRKQAEIILQEKNQLLIEAKERAEESDRLKSAFLANMSHEIRTPLNSIIGFSDLLLDPDFDSNQHDEFIRMIGASGNNLLAIITDIMDLSKIESGLVSMNFSYFSVPKFLDDIQKQYSIKAAEKRIEFRVNTSNSDEDMYLESDETKLKQIMVNFVGNAIKFTEKGYIEIGFRKIENTIKFYVKDSGIGIPEEYHKKIFERFRQVDSSYTRKYGGNGLGLAISKSLAELLGGEIGMESEKGEGSTFFITIPAHTKQLAMNS
jgi:PAS domain S-box-containing protein